MLDVSKLAEKAVVALSDKKAKEIRLLMTKDVTVLADYFIICTATSTTHMKTLADEVDKALSEAGEPALRTEGNREGGWVLVDFGCIVVHIFLEDIRKFYSLEHLWNDAPEVDISTMITQ